MSRAGALKRHIKRYQQSQHAVLAFVRAFIDAHGKYEQEYGELAASCQSFAKRKIDEPLLNDAVQDLKNAFKASANSLTTLLEELTRFVLSPLEAVISQDQLQIKRLYSDIKSALQREKVYRSHLLFVVARPRCPTSDTSLVRLFQRQLSFSVLDNQASDLHANDESQLKQMMELRSRRDHERSECYRLLNSITMNQDQYGISLRVILTRFMMILEQYSKTTFAGTKWGRIKARVHHSGSQIQVHDGSVGHIEIMTWMISSFSKLISMEESITKWIKRFVKDHCFIFVDAVSLLEPFVEYHKLLALDLADPICRTLNCSKLKYEAIERELLQAIEKTQNSLRASQEKLTVQETRWKQRRAMLEEPADGASVSLSFAARFATMMSGNALLRTWSRLRRPRMKLPKSKGVNSADLVVKISEGRPDEQLLWIEIEITKTRELTTTLEKILASQRSEMKKILAETSAIGVKTMKLVVDDYQNKVATALQSVNAALKAIKHITDFDPSAQGVDFRSCITFEDDSLCRNLNDKAEYEAIENGKLRDIEVGSEDVIEASNQVDSVPQSAQAIETKWTYSPSQPDLIMPTKLDVSVDNESESFVSLEAAVENKRNGNCIVHVSSFLILLWIIVTVTKLNTLDSAWQELQIVQAGNAQRLEDLRNLLG